MLAGGELVGVWPEGFKGIGKPFHERYKLQRFGRGGFVVGGAAHRRTDRAAVRGRRRGDLPADRQHPVAGAAARHPLRPDHAALPVARTARAGAAAVEVADGVRRADPHRRVRRRARPTTRCSSSTSPTRCARRSSSRSTRCSGSASRSGADAARQGERRQARRQRAAEVVERCRRACRRAVLPTSPDGVEQVARGVGDRRPEVGLLVVGQPVGEVLQRCAARRARSGSARSGAVCVGSVTLAGGRLPPTCGQLHAAGRRCRQWSWDPARGRQRRPARSPRPPRPPG